MQNERIGFFQKLIISIKDFDKYIFFATEKITDALKYLLKIMLIFSVIISIGFTYIFYKTVQDGIQFFNENIKSIEYSGNKLSINEDNPLVIENENLIIQYISINTETTSDSFEFDDKSNLYDTAVVILKDKILVKNSVYNTLNSEYSYEELSKQYNIGDFSKEQVINFINKINNPYLYLGVYISIYIYVFLVYTISSLFDILILTLLGYIIARISRIKLKIGSTFNIGVHALTLPLILNLIYIIVNLFTGFTIKYFEWMYTTISYIYVVVAILMIKTDIINTHIELAKIVKEQEKVRKEIKQKDEDKNEDKKRNDEENKDDKNTENGEEPDGSEA